MIIDPNPSNPKRFSATANTTLPKPHPQCHYLHKDRKAGPQWSWEAAKKFSKIDIFGKNFEKSQISSKKGWFCISDRGLDHFCP